MKKGRARKFLAGAGFLAAGVTGVYLLGPRTEVDETLVPRELPVDLDTYLTESESAFTDIRPNTEKRIIWNDPETREKTPYSVVYLHGFSATRMETAPLCDEIAEQLGANLFYTRLTGHGRSGEAMAEGTVNSWLNDGAEALEIGRRIGEKVILVGTSTGATISAWLDAHLPDSDIAANVMISPNFKPHGAGVELLSGPWGERLGKLLIGEYREWEAQNEQQQQYWSTRYPTSTLTHLMGLVDVANESNLEGVKTPVLLIYNSNDDVVRVPAMLKAFERLGSSSKHIVSVDSSGDLSNHVIAGSIMSPNNTSLVKTEILSFLTSIGVQAAASAIPAE